MTASFVTPRNVFWDLFLPNSSWRNKSDYFFADHFFGWLVFRWRSWNRVHFCTWRNDDYFFVDISPVHPTGFFFCFFTGFLAIFILFASQQQQLTIMEPCTVLEPSSLSMVHGGYKFYIMNSNTIPMSEHV